MGDWMMEHPWMTFFLISAAIWALEEIVANICRTILFLKCQKYEDKKKTDN